MATGDLGLGFGTDGTPLVPEDAPYEFPTVDPDGNPLPEGKVFYRGLVMNLAGATEAEKAWRHLRILGKPI